MEKLLAKFKNTFNLNVIINTNNKFVTLQVLTAASMKLEPSAI
jgi:hypothetical protein